MHLSYIKPVMQTAYLNFVGKFCFLSASKIVTKDGNFLGKIQILCSGGVRVIFTFLYPFLKQFFRST